MMAMEGSLWGWNPLNWRKPPTLSDRFLVIRPCIKVSAAQRLGCSGVNRNVVPWIDDFIMYCLIVCRLSAAKSALSRQTLFVNDILSVS